MNYQVGDLVKFRCNSIIDYGIIHEIDENNSVHIVFVGDSGNDWYPMITMKRYFQNLSNKDKQ